jgi:hypothetical protein
MGPPLTSRDDVLSRLSLPLLILTSLAVSLQPGLQSDTYWHMASGRWMIQESSWLRNDVFSWTVLGEPWSRPGLPADIVMYGLYELGSEPLLAIVTAVIFTAAFLLLFLTVPASPRVRLTLGVLAIFASVVSASVRPLVLALPLTAFTAVVLDREARSAPTQWLWAIPFISIVWVNTHGTFVLPFLLLGCHALGALIDLVGHRHEGSRARLLRLVAAGTLSLLGIVVNPFGARMLLYPFEFAAVRVHHEGISEWQSPRFDDPQAWPLFVLLAIGVYALVRHRGRTTTHDLILLVAFGGLALTAIRHSSVFAIVAYPQVARLLSGDAAIRLRSQSLATNPGQRRAEIAIIAVLLGLVLFLTAPALTRAGNERATGELMPLEAADAVVDSAPVARLWNSFDVGGYVIWRGAPELLVSMDSRADLYGDDLVREHIAEWYGERDAPERFADQGIDTVLVERYAPLVAQLEAADWIRVEDDGFGVVLRAPDAAGSPP